MAGISVVPWGLPDGAQRRGGGEVVIIVIVLNVGPGLGRERRGRPEHLRLFHHRRLLLLGRRRLLLLLERLERREHVAAADPHLLGARPSPVPSPGHLSVTRNNNHNRREKEKNLVLPQRYLGLSELPDLRQGTGGARGRACLLRIGENRARETKETHRRAELPRGCLLEAGLEFAGFGFRRSGEDEEGGGLRATLRLSLRFAFATADGSTARIVS